MLCLFLLSGLGWKYSTFGWPSSDALNFELKGVESTRASLLDEANPIYDPPNTSIDSVLFTSMSSYIFSCKDSYLEFILMYFSSGGSKNDVVERALESEMVVLYSFSSYFWELCKLA